MPTPYIVSVSNVALIRNNNKGDSVTIILHYIIFVIIFMYNKFVLISIVDNFFGVTIWS